MLPSENVMPSSGGPLIYNLKCMRKIIDEQKMLTRVIVLITFFFTHRESIWYRCCGPIGTLSPQMTPLIFWWKI